MRRPLSTLLLQFLFWLLFFNINRLVFVAWHAGILMAENIPVSGIAGVFVHSLKLDMATTCYFLVLPFFLTVLGFFWQTKIPGRIIKFYHLVLVTLYSLSTAGEMGIYAEWKTKLNYKVIKYFANPSEIYDSAETSIFFLLILLFLGMTVFGIWLYSRFFHRETPLCPPTWKARLLFIAFLPGALFLGMRGGIQEIPINQSESYFSKYNILNIAAVNNGFNLYISIFENLQNFDHNPYIFMDSAKASELMKELYQVPSDSTVKILNSPRPNIVLLIMESWSADLIEALGGEEGITPEFDRLTKEGLLFTGIYSSGSRSEQGMASIFSGFPSHPVSSVTVQPDKIVRLPSLVRDMRKEGYYTAFYFGGQLIYGNMKSYMLFNGFDRIMEGVDFPSSIPRGKLGIHDQYTLSFMLTEMDKMKEPFFSSLFTVSTHSPWDQPFDKPITWGENEREYLNAALYTDHCLGEFFREAAGKHWFDNTLFVIVADHSHNSYRNWHPHSREYRRIPLLLLGPALKEEWKGKRWDKTGNQHDLPATLLALLGKEFNSYSYSKNLLNPGSKEFAYYSTEDGVGWYSPEGYFTYEKTGNHYYWWTDPNLSDSVRQQGFAYLQTVFSDYLDK